MIRFFIVYPSFPVHIGVSKTFWTCSKDGVIKAPLSKGAANKLLEAIYRRGIHAVGVYEFAEGIGEFVHGTANPSTTFGGPPPFDKGGFAQKPSSPTILTYTFIYSQRIAAFAAEQKRTRILCYFIIAMHPTPCQHLSSGLIF